MTMQACELKKQPQVMPLDHLVMYTTLLEDEEKAD